MIKVRRIGWLPEKAQEIVDLLKYDFNIIYEDAASIGKRFKAFHNWKEYE